MNQINTFGWKSPIIDFVKSGKPVLGICLGMQLLFTYGDEFGYEKGLNLIPGNVKKLVHGYVRHACVEFRPFQENTNETLGTPQSLRNRKTNPHRNGNGNIACL